jgi:hypothetical protein
LRWLWIADRCASVPYPRSPCLSVETRSKRRIFPACPPPASQARFLSIRSQIL